MVVTQEKLSGDEIVQAILWVFCRCTEDDAGDCMATKALLKANKLLLLLCRVTTEQCNMCISSS